MFNKYSKSVGDILVKFLYYAETLNLLEVPILTFFYIKQCAPIAEVFVFYLINLITVIKHYCTTLTFFVIRHGRFNFIRSPCTHTYLKNSVKLVARSICYADQPNSQGARGRLVGQKARLWRVSGATRARLAIFIRTLTKLVAYNIRRYLLRCESKK